MLFEITFRRIIEIQADSYDEAENKAYSQLHHLLHDSELTMGEVFDVNIHKEEVDLSTMGGS